MLPLAIALLLAGCNAPAADDPPAEVPDDDPGRTARGGGSLGDDEEGDEQELQAVELLQTPLTFAGQGPESFDVTVPPGIVAVGFEFRGDVGFQQSGLRIELTGCGTYDTGVGFTGSTGSGVSYSDQLCNEAPAGPATVTISATFMVFDGTFTLTGYSPVDPGSGGSATPGA